jgi:O-antigen ligase
MNRMDSAFLLEVAVAAIVCFMAGMGGRLILSHPISRRWNPDFDGFVIDIPFYIAITLAFSQGLFGNLAFMIGLLLGASPLLIWKLLGRDALKPYNEPLPPLPKRAVNSAPLRKSENSPPQES